MKKSIIFLVVFVSLTSVLLRASQENYADERENRRRAEDNIVQSFPRAKGKRPTLGDITKFMHNSDNKQKSPE